MNLPAWILISPGHAFLAAGAGVREAVSDALATLYSVAEIRSRRDGDGDGQLANGDADTNTVLEAIGGVPDATRAAIKAAGLAPDTEGMARATLELWPIFDHVSMTQELAILARLGRHVASASAGGGEVRAVLKAALRSKP
jgi:hypothetical protein